MHATPTCEGKGQGLRGGGHHGGRTERASATGMPHPPPRPVGPLQLTGGEWSLQFRVVCTSGRCASERSVLARRCSPQNSDAEPSGTETLTRGRACTSRALPHKSDMFMAGHIRRNRNSALTWCPSCTYSTRCSSTAHSSFSTSLSLLLLLPRCCLARHCAAPHPRVQVSHEHQERTQRCGAAHVEVPAVFRFTTQVQLFVDSCVCLCVCVCIDSFVCRDVWPCLELLAKAGLSDEEATKVPPASPASPSLSHSLFGMRACW